MSFFSGKKLLLFGFIFVLLIAIPVTVYLVSQQQKTKSNATAATTLSFSPVNQAVAKGATASFDIYVDPSSGNQVSSVKVLLSYDTTKLATTGAGLQINSWTAADGTPFTPAIFQPPTFGPGTIAFTISVGSSPQNVITTHTKIATVTFKAVAPTDVGVPTEITFGNQSQILNLGGSAEGGENILSNTSSGKVTISDVAATATPTVTPIPTTAATATPTTTTVTTTQTTTPTVTTTPGNGLKCTDLALDPGNSGTVPFSVNLTATGNSTGSAITKVSFDFGDGENQDVSDSGGIGTSSVSVLISHTYAASGTFNATATITDENDTVSSGGCTATIKVADNTTGTPTIANNPSPLPPTGPRGILTVGAIGVMLTFIGAILLLAL